VAPVFTALLPVINPLGTALVLLSLTGSLPQPQRKHFATTVALYTAGMLTFFLIAGSEILGFFGVSLPVVQVAGGLVVAGMGWRLLNQEDSGQSPKTPSRTLDQAEIENRTFYPYTFPITVGPGCLSVILTFSAHIGRGSVTEDVVEHLGAMVGIGAGALSVYLSIYYVDVIVRVLGPKAIGAISRLLAFFLTCIGAEILWNGVKALAHQL